MVVNIFQIFSKCSLIKEHYLFLLIFMTEGLLTQVGWYSDILVQTSVKILQVVLSFVEKKLVQLPPIRISYALLDQQKRDPQSVSFCMTSFEKVILLSNSICLAYFVPNSIFAFEKILHTGRKVTYFNFR